MKKFTLPISMLLLFAAIALGGGLQVQKINEIEENGVTTTAEVIGGRVKRHADGSVESGALKVKFLPKDHPEPVETSISLSGSYMGSVVGGSSKIFIKSVEIKYLPDSPQDALVVGESEIGLAKGLFWTGLVLAGIVLLLTVKPFLRRNK